MSLFDWIASLRKKPLEVRRRIAAVMALWIMGAVTAVWFIFFFSGLSDRLEKFKGTQNASPEGSGASSFFSDLESKLPPMPTLPDIDFSTTTQTQPEAAQP